MTDPAPDSGAPSPGGELRGIQDVASALGITMRTLRFYEDKGLVAPQRIGTMRVYGRREFARMQLILRGKRLGFSIREIREFLDLYDADPAHLEQSRRFAVRVRERLDELAKQKIAIEQTMAELRQLEGEALAHLAATGG